MSINDLDCQQNLGCKANCIKKINRTVCRNNCRNWKYNGKKDKNGNDVKSCAFNYK